MDIGFGVGLGAALFGAGLCVWLCCIGVSILIGSHRDWEDE